MHDPIENVARKCAQGFARWEKVLSRTGFVLGLAVGASGIWLSSPYFALAYLAYAAGSFTLLMRYTVCPRCPHLLEAGDCLFVPAPLVRRIVSRNSGPLRPWEMSILLAAALGTDLIPVPWLWPNPWLLALYILCVGGYTLLLALHICKKCRVEVCPLNRYRQNIQE